MSIPVHLFTVFSTRDSNEALKSGKHKWIVYHQNLNIFTFLKFEVCTMFPAYFP